MYRNAAQKRKREVTRRKLGPHYYCFATPRWVREAIVRDYGFPAIDACASHGLHFGQRWYGPEQDGLRQEWAKDAKGGVVWCNPPFDARGGLDRWCAKCFREAQKGCQVVAMLPLWRQYAFVEFCFERAEIRFSRNPIVLYGFGPMRGRKSGNVNWTSEYETFIAVFRAGGPYGVCGDWLTRVD